MESPSFRAYCRWFSLQAYCRWFSLQISLIETKHKAEHQSSASQDMHKRGLQSTNHRVQHSHAFTLWSRSFCLLFPHRSAEEALSSPCITMFHPLKKLHFVFSFKTPVS